MSSDPLEKIIENLRAFAAPLANAKLNESQNNQAPDSRTGIYLEQLGEIKSSDCHGQTFNYYCARIDPGNYVRPHFHERGDEPYLILGEGAEMNLGRCVENNVTWEEPFKPLVGSAVVVQEGQVHCLRNAGAQSLDFVFSCPETHLVDNDADHPDGDRYFTDTMTKGLPDSAE